MLHNKYVTRSSMVWSNAKDLQLLKQIAVEGVLTHKQRSKDRGTKWQKVADNIIVSVGHDLTFRAARDRYNMVAKKYRARMAREERATGEGGEELTENESLLEELIEIEDETERQMENENEAKNKRIDQERVQALEMRERAMERLGQTRKRVGEASGNGKPAQKRRRSGDMMEWLQERVELEKEEKELKHHEKKEFMEAQRMQHAEMMQIMQQSQQQFSMQVKLSEQHLQHQMQQQQQMQQQLMALMQQQQQQTQLLARMLEKNF